MRYHAVYVYALGFAAVVLTGCGRQGELVAPEAARPVDPAIERYFEGGLDGPMKAPGDTETEKPLRKRSPHEHEGGDDEGDAGGGNAEAAGGDAEPESGEGDGAGDSAGAGDGDGDAG